MLSSQRLPSFADPDSDVSEASTDSFASRAGLSSRGVASFRAHRPGEPHSRCTAFSSNSLDGGELLRQVLARDLGVVLSLHVDEEHVTET